jgi:hypothetical protein
LANHSDPQSDIELDKDLIEVVRQLSTAAGGGRRRSAV